MPSKNKTFYAVERILNKKGYGKNVRYLVKWKGYGEDANSWEPARNCNCPDLIKKFEAFLQVKNQKPRVNNRQERKATGGIKLPEWKKKTSAKKNATTGISSAEADNAANDQPSASSEETPQNGDTSQETLPQDDDAAASQEEELPKYKPINEHESLKFTVTEIEDWIGEITDTQQRVLVRTEDGKRQFAEIKAVAKQDPEKVLDFLIARYQAGDEA